MIKKIPQNFINELLIRTNIVDLINQRIQLKKTGKNYQANCPFHNDSNPSFTINQEKQFYHCFGCNSHGNVIDFLMNYEHLNFLETIEELSIIHGLTLPVLSKFKTNQNEYFYKNQLYSLMNKIAKIYMANLNAANTGSIALKYLNSRGINAEMLHLFSIGYATQQMHFSSIFNKNKTDIKINKFIASGVIVIDNQG
ncbi:DNA primase, partial [Buchnera aphidicola (Hormaphis cornu)]